MRFVHFKTIDSTLSEAKRLASSNDFGPLDPLWISADIQSNGRGRQGRDWVSDVGNLFCTGLYPHAGDIASAARLSFAAALAVAHTLEHYIDPSLITIKWPNDVLVDGKKIAGILLESGTQNNQIWVAIGIGINLVSHPEPEGYAATHLLAHISPQKLTVAEPIFTGAQPVLAILAQNFENWHARYINNGFEPLREAWLNRAVGIHGPVTARLANKTITGTAVGLNHDGALEVEIKSGEIVQIHAGDVFFSPRVL